MKRKAARKNIVFLMAHPDDVAIHAGGTALLLTRRYNLHVMCVTRGERGIKGKTNAQAAVIRAREEVAACRILGADLTFLDQVDQDIFAGREAVKSVAKLLRKLRPVALFTHWPLTKRDHAAASNLAWMALEDSDLFWTTEVYMGSIGGSYSNVHPELFVNITDVVEEKKKLLMCHKSQISKRGIDGLLARNQAAGRQAWCDYAEAFYPGVALAARRWNRKAGSILLDL